MLPDRRRKKTIARSNEDTNFSHPVSPACFLTNNYQYFFIVFILFIKQSRSFLLCFGKIIQCCEQISKF